MSQIRDLDWLKIELRLSFWVAFNRNFLSNLWGPRAFNQKFCWWRFVKLIRGHKNCADIRTINLVSEFTQFISRVTLRCTSWKMSTHVHAEILAFHGLPVGVLFIMNQFCFPVSIYRFQVHCVELWVFKHYAKHILLPFNTSIHHTTNICLSLLKWFSETDFATAVDAALSFLSNNAARTKARTIWFHFCWYPRGNNI